MANIAHLEGANVYFLLDRDTGRIVGFKDGNNQDQFLSEAGGDFFTALQQLSDSTNASIALAKDECKARENGTGYDPAVNVKLTSGETVEAAIADIRQKLSGASPSAPSLTTDPTIATTTGSDGAVGSIMTATTGTVSGTATQTLWQWNRVNASTAPAAIVGATAATYQRTAADFNQGGTPYRLTATEIIVGPTGLPSAARTSAQSSVTTATAPSNSVAPAITPSGSQVNGTLLTSTSGTFTGGATPYTYGYQFYVDIAGGTNYAAIGSRTSTATITPSLSQVGKLRVGVIATGADGVKSTEAFSNVITVTGSPTVTNASVPALAATVTATVQGAITPAVWNVSGGAVLGSPSWDFYLDGSSSAYRTNTNPLYTPEQANVGKSVLIIERITDTTTGQQYQAQSAAKTIQAVPAALAATVAVAATTLTQNSAATAFNPVTVTGGTNPVTYSVSPALPTGLSLNASTGQISGTPTVSSSLATYTMTIIDSAGSPATVTGQFTITVSAAGVTPLTRMTPWSVDQGGVQATTWYDDSAPLGGAITRWALVDDPGGSGQKVYLCRVVSGDGLIVNGNRAEAVFSFNPKTNPQGNTSVDMNSFFWRDQECTFAFAIWLPATSGNDGWPSSSSPTATDDRQDLFQVHAANGESPDLALQFRGQSGMLRWYVNGTDASVAAGDIQVSADWEPPRAQWVKFIGIRNVKTGASNSASTLLIYRAVGNGAYTQICTRTTGAYGWVGDGSDPHSDYPKGAIYKYGLNYGGTLTRRTVYWRALFKSAGSKLAEAQASLSTV